MTLMKYLTKMILIQLITPKTIKHRTRIRPRMPQMEQINLIIHKTQMLQTILMGQIIKQMKQITK